LARAPGRETTPLGLDQQQLSPNCHHTAATQSPRLSGDGKTRRVGLSGAVASLVVVVPFVTRGVTGRFVGALLSDPSGRQGDAGLAPAAGLIRSLSGLVGVTHCRPAAAVSLHQTGVTGPYEWNRRISRDACR
jgi:hypothetical protein